MAVVLAGGEVRPGDGIGIELPAAPHRRLEVVLKAPSPAAGQLTGGVRVHTS